MNSSSNCAWFLSESCEYIWEISFNDKIEKYQNYYNKALEASDAVQDLQDKLAELAKTKFDNVNSEYETQLIFLNYRMNQTGL